MANIRKPGQAAPPRDRIIPNWSFPRRDNTGQAGSGVANAGAAGSTPKDLSVYALGREEIIPILYGGPERMAGLLYIVATPKAGALAGKLVICSILCEGPIESVYGFEVDNVALPSYVQVTAYTGAPGQGVDPWLSSAVPGFAETLPGIAYYVALVTPTNGTFPNITALVKGMKVFDPRLAYVDFPQWYATTPNAVANSATSALELIIQVAMDDMTPFAQQDFASVSSGDPNRAWEWGVAATGHVFLQWWPTGSAASGLVATPTTPLPAVAGQRMWHKMRFTGNNGAGSRVIEFFTSLDYEPFTRTGTWTQLGATFTGAATTLVDAVANLVVGGRNASFLLDGKVFYFEMRKVLDGPATAVFNPREAANAATVWVSSLGETWTLMGTGYSVTNTLGVAPANVAWSDNPALCLHDFMVRHAELPVDAAYTASAADWDDRLLTGPGGTEKFARMTLTLAVIKQCQEWVEIMRAYVPAWVVNAGEAWRIVADMPRATDHFFSTATINGDNPPQITRGGTSDVPNYVEIEYTDVSKVPWQTLSQHAELPDVVDLRRNKTALPGIRSPAQAKRFAVERLNHYTLEDVSGNISVFDEGLRVLKGDVISVSEPAFGWTGKLVRVMDAVERDTGLWDVQFREYDIAAYSAEVALVPTTPDTTLSSPLVALPASGLVVEEYLAPESEVPDDGIGKGIIYQSRVRVSWTESPDPYVDKYEVQVRLGSVVFSSLVARGIGTYTSATVKQLTEYVVAVTAINSFGVRSTEIFTSIFIDGKQLPPGPVPAITQAFESGGDVLLAWEPALDFDTLRYEIRVDLGNTGAAWDDQVLVDSVDGLRTRVRGQPEGTHRYCIKAIDSVGHYSLVPTCAVVEVTSDQASFLSEMVYVAPTLSRMVALAQPFAEDESASLRPRWITNANKASWDYDMPSPIDSGVDPVFTYGAGGDSVAGANLITFPDAFDNAAWTKSAVTVTANAVAAPGGAVTADLLTNNTAGLGRASQGVGAIGSRTYRIRAQLKKSTVALVRMDADTTGGADPTRFNNVTFNLDTGTVSSSTLATNAIIRPNPLLAGWWDVSFNVATASTHNTLIAYGYASIFNTNGATYYAAFGVELVEGISSWRGEVQDIGLEVVGNFYVNANVVVYKGSAKKYLEHSLDGVAWVAEDLTAGVAWKGSARYARPYIVANALGDSFVVQGYPRISVNADERTESGGPTLSSATLATVVTLARRYAKATSIVITPVSASARTFSVNAVVVGTGVTNTFEVRLFNPVGGAQVADNFMWNFRGV